MTTTSPKKAKPNPGRRPANKTKTIAGSKRNRESESQPGLPPKRPALLPFDEDASSLLLAVGNDNDEIYNAANAEGDEEDDGDEGEDELDELSISIETRFQLIQDSSATTEYAHLDEDDGSQVTASMQAYLEGK